MNYPKFFVAAITATVVMTGFMLLAPVMGLPKMNAGELLGVLFGGSMVAGWIMHFVIGIVLAFIYVMFLDEVLPVENNVLRGLIYGIFVFLASEIIFALVNFTGLLKWDLKEDMAMMVFGNAIGCLIYGAVLGAFYKNHSVSTHHLSHHHL